MDQEEIPDLWLREIGKKHVKISTENEPYEASKKLKEFREKDGLEFVGKGSSRYVYRLSNVEPAHIVKFPIQTEFRKGTNCNKVELYIWSALTQRYGDSAGTYDSIKGRFTPVVRGERHGRWLVMKELEETSDANDPEQKKNAILNQLPYLPHNCEFLLPDNIGFYRGEKHNETGYRIFDYGSYIPRIFLETELGIEHINHIENNINGDLIVDS